VSDDSGIKGNISTYQLDQGQIASMIDGTIMLQQAKLLAATIGITFVGPKNLPDRCLPDISKVMRTRVQRVLEYYFSDTTGRTTRKRHTIRIASHYEAFYQHQQIAC
jgi:hypothetical protein